MNPANCQKARRCATRAKRTRQTAHQSPRAFFRPVREGPLSGRRHESLQRARLPGAVLKIPPRPAGRDCSQTVCSDRRPIPAVPDQPPAVRLAGRPGDDRPAIRAPPHPAGGSGVLPGLLPFRPGVRNGRLQPPTAGRIGRPGDLRTNRGTRERLADDRSCPSIPQQLPPHSLRKDVQPRFALRASRLGQTPVGRVCGLPERAPGAGPKTRLARRALGLAGRTACGPVPACAGRNSPPSVRRGEPR